MQPSDFAFWLRGFAEIAGEQTVPNPTQWQIIMDHLNTVFTKVTPDRHTPLETLNQLRVGEWHGGGMVGHPSGVPLTADGAPIFCVPARSDPLVAESALKVVDLLSEGPICGMSIEDLARMTGDAPKEGQMPPLPWDGSYTVRTC